MKAKTKDRIYTIIAYAIVVVIAFAIAEIENHFNPRAQTQSSYECTCEHCEEQRSCEENMRDYYDDTRYDDVRGGHFRY